MNEDEHGHQMSEQLAAGIREALARVERGQVVDLGSFAQYSDDDTGALSGSRDAPEVPSGTANRTLSLVNTLRDQLIGN